MRNYNFVPRKIILCWIKCYPLCLQFLYLLFTEIVFVEDSLWFNFFLQLTCLRSVLCLFPSVHLSMVVCKESLIKTEKLWTPDVMLSFLFVLICLNILAGFLYFGVKNSNEIPKTHVPSSTSLRLACETNCASWRNWNSWKWGSNSESCRWADWKSMEAALPQGMLRRKPWLLSFCKSSVFSYNPCQCLYSKRTFPHVLQLWCRHNILNLHSKFQALCSTPSTTCESPVLFLLFLQLCILQVAFLAKCLAEESTRNIYNNTYFFKSKHKKQKTQGRNSRKHKV